MTVLDEAETLARSGRDAEAVNLVENAARRGDSEAMLRLAEWKLFAEHCERDIPAAHKLLAAAASAGNVEAARLRAFLIGNGTGCKSDPERAQKLLRKIAAADQYSALQLHFLPKMLSLAQARALPTQILSRDPPVRLVKGALSADERNYLCTMAEPSLQPSVVIDPASGRRIPHPVRTSEGMSFGPAQEDLVIHMINRRLAALTGTQVGWGEPLHILRYAPGQEYKLHVDALPGAANQRQWTVLIYLNGDYEGGETHFPDLGLTVRGQPGDALIFRDVDDLGAGDLRTRHAGLPVRAGVKWLATRWIRQAPYSPWA